MILITQNKKEKEILKFKKKYVKLLGPCRVWTEVYFGIYELYINNKQTDWIKYTNHTNTQRDIVVCGKGGNFTN